MLWAIIGIKGSGHSVHRFRGRGVVPTLGLLILLFAIVDFQTTFALQQSPGGAPQNRSETPSLEPGKPVERNLAGGQSHSYQLSLNLDQYALVVVDQRGIDVVFAVFGPDAKKIVEVDSANGLRGLENLSVLAAKSGIYRFEVRSDDKKAAPGRYEIKIEQLRPATAQDPSRIAAQTAYVQAGELAQRFTPDAFKKSLPRFEEALSLWRQIGDKGREAETLLYISQVYYQLDERQKALELYERTLSLYHSLGYTAEEATILNNLGVIYERVGDRRKALDCYDRTLTLSRLRGDRDGEAITLMNIALVYHYLGQHQLSLDYNNRALAIHRETGNQQQEANTLLNMGVLYRDLGEIQQALDYDNESLRLQRIVGNKKEEANVLSNIGAVYQGMGKDRQALEYYAQALGIARSIGARASAATKLNNMGAVYQNLGDYPKALAHYTEALSLYEATSELQGKALTLNNLGMYYKDTGENEKALEYYNQALKLRRAVGESSGEAATLYNIAKLERDRSNLVVAREYIDKTLAVVESMRANVASQRLRASYFATVRKYHEFNIDLLMRLHKQRPSEGFDAAALEASERSRARSLLELLGEANAEIRQGVDPALLERESTLRQMLADSAERQRQMLRRKHSDEEAAAATKELGALTVEYEQIESRIRTSSPRYAALIQPAPLDLKAIQQQALDGDTVLLEYSLGTQKSFLWAVTPASINSFELPKRAEIEEAARRLFELSTARNQSPPKETPEQRQQRLERADAECSAAAATLGRMVLGPAADQLKNKRVVIVGDGVLQYVPFGALASPLASDLHPLVVDNEIVSLPSASVLAVLRQETAGRKPASKALAVLADPVFASDDPRVSVSARPAAPSTNTTSPTADAKRSAAESGLADLVRLRFSRQEADAITRLAAVKTKLEAVDFAASRTLASSGELGAYRIIHFATHGLINNEHPELSGIVLSLVDQQGRPQDGFLRLYDIYNLKLAADLVVLSACQTALGKEVSGEGIVGLTRGFMYAGAQRVIASLWRIDDRATAELMKRFYTAMLGDSLRPAAALRSAQISMWREKRWQAPYYWAAFTLQGEWR